MTLSPRGHLAVSGDIFRFKGGEDVLLPYIGTLLNILQSTGQAPPTDRNLASNVSSAKSEKH